MSMLSSDIARWKSGAASSRVILPVSTSMITRLIMATSGSPGSGYFHARRTGWPPLTGVCTRYMSPTLRSSCCCVAIFLPSGDQESAAAVLVTQPALLVAYPKSLTPSVVSWRSWPVATSCTQRFQSQMKTALLPSGDSEDVGAADVPVTLGPHFFAIVTPPRPPRPPPGAPPPRPPRPPGPPAFAPGPPAG